MDIGTVYAHLGYTLTELFQFVDGMKSFWKWNGPNIQFKNK